MEKEYWIVASLVQSPTKFEVTDKSSKFSLELWPFYKFSRDWSQIENIERPEDYKNLNIMNQPSLLQIKSWWLWLQHC